jgi:putative hydrolase of the HAD superfamily
VADARAEAILFDLFGTLVGFSFPDWDAFGARLAQMFRAPRAEFVRLLDEGYFRLEVGALALPQMLEQVAREAGGEATPSNTAEAVRRWNAFQATQMVPYPDAPPALALAKQRGRRVGLVSNAPPPLHELWPASPLARYVDATAFSYQVGACKPEPGIYAWICRSLGVAPEHCLFVGDGSSRELTGAIGFGMQAVRLRRADEVAYDARFRRERWEGPAISTLLELLPLLQE